MEKLELTAFVLGFQSFLTKLPPCIILILLSWQIKLAVGVSSAGPTLSWLVQCQTSTGGTKTSI